MVMVVHVWIHPTLSTGFQRDRFLSNQTFLSSQTFKRYPFLKQMGAVPGEFPWWTHWANRYRSCHSVLAYLLLELPTLGAKRRVSAGCERWGTSRWHEEKGKDEYMGCTHFLKVKHVRYFKRWVVNQALFFEGGTVHEKPYIPILVDKDI